MENNPPYPELLWAGTDQSFEIALAARNSIMAGVYGDSPRIEVEDPAPYLFDQQGDIGIINIRGALVNDDSPYNRYFGVTSYSDIRRALVYAAGDQSVKAILLDIVSGGGAVNGVDDTAMLISSIHKGVKPVYAYTEALMASAAVWLGVSAGAGVHLGRTAIMGSIGVITTHKEYSKMFKDEGIGVTVMRSGRFKALATTMEPLSDVAKEQIQDQLNATYEVFANHVAGKRKVTMAVFEATMGQGREFLGQAAVDSGLADSVTNFDALMSKISAKVIDRMAKQEQTSLSFPRGTQMKQALTEQQIAALAAGGSTGIDVEAAAAAAAIEAVAAADAAAAAAAAAAAVIDAAATATQPANAVVTLLQGQVREANTQVVTLTVEMTALKAKVASLEVTQPDLLKIAAASLSNIKVALGFSGFDASALAPEQLVVEHTKAAEVFAKSFKSGGVAAVSQVDAAAEINNTLADAKLRSQIAANRHVARK